MMLNFNKQIQNRFSEMEKRGKLFRVALTGDQLWEIYLKSFKEEDNPVFRDPASTTHNCNLCNNFVRRYGNIVSIGEDYSIETMFDGVTEAEYAPSAEAMSKALKASTVKDVFFETFNELNSLPYESCSKTNSVFRLGVHENVKRYTAEEAEKFGVVKPNEIKKFDHMHLNLSKQYVDTTDASIESIMGEFRSSKEVFKRAMDEIALDTFNLVKDLIIQNSLLDGQTHLHKIEKMIPLKTQYDKVPEANKDNWCWVNSYKLPFAKFRNELIGVLCSELSQGEELNKACESWNKRVDPVNYMKATAPITKKQIEEAKKFVEENGYTESFNRRFATIDDIKATEIKHINVGEQTVKGVSMFDSVKATATRHKRSEFDNVEEVTIDKFMSDILPGCSSVEVLLKNSHEGHMVSLTTADNPESKPIFKWPNNYSWTFNGNLAGKSQIKEAVKGAGGKVDGVLRFSMIWNEDGQDGSDLDAWCLQPDSVRIGFNTGYRRDSGGKFTALSGQLDLDNTHPGGKLAIENIYFKDQSKMRDGVYLFWVNQFSARNSKGFKAEIEFDGQMFSYEYNRPVSGSVKIAEVTLKDGEFTIKHLLAATEGEGVSKEIYGLETNHFHKVNLLCVSPNHWNGSNVGNKHYFFMLENCKTPQSIRSFHNENLIPELITHRKVMEVLGATNVIAPSKKQLSGLGFNATVRDEVIVKLGGSFKRMLKVKFG